MNLKNPVRIKSRI